MSVGLFELLKDVSLMAKAAAASLDDVAAASLKATSKAAGVVIDDAAVSPNMSSALRQNESCQLFAQLLSILSRISFFTSYLQH